MRVVNRLASCVALATALCAPIAHAVSFEMDVGDGISGTLNTSATFGAGWRMQDRSPDLVGKGNLNPDVCGGIAQSCQGVFRDQIHPAQTLADSPGQAYLNADDGNWNYDKHDLTQGVFKVTQDLNVSYGEYGVFAKWLYFYDWVNNDFDEYHPNMITAENRDRVGCTEDSGGTPDDGSADCLNTTNFDRSYGPGEPTRRKRTDGETLRQIGTDLQMFDYYMYGSFDLPFFEEMPVSFKVGNQTINWGESTALVINSVNQVNPVNANNLFRTGFDLSELFVPTGMAFFSIEPFESATIEAFYGYEWKPVEIPAPGSFFSFADVGTNNAGDYASISFGGPAEDPDVCDQDGVAGGPSGTGSGGPLGSDPYSNPVSGCGSPQNNPLSGLTNTSLTIRRIDDNEARDTGQWGFSFKYFADWLNNGTELAFYFMNYHSQLPYVSTYSTVASCARAEGNDGGIDATNGLELLAACPDLPVVYAGDSAAARGATSNAVPIDTVRFQLEYPEDIHLFGFSFNTTVGDISLQGEVAYRPDMPLQVDTQDLTFHALGPMLSRCHDASQGCTGTTGGTSTVDGETYLSSDFLPYPGVTGYNDTFDLAVGAAVGSARSFPSFVGAWRGVAPGETPPNSYIRGWENFDVWQFNLGATYVQGATDNVIGADQLIWLFEVGAQWVPDLPGTDQLQIEAPGTHYHASAGADGSMSGNMQQDCAHTVDCSYGGYNPENGEFFGTCDETILADSRANQTPATGCGDGLRFNPHQQDADMYADKFSAGYVIVSLIRYESVLPGVSLAPLTLFQHDVVGTSTDVATQFSEGRMDIVMGLEVRYKESFSFTPGYMWFTGGGSANLHRDRDQAFAFLKYLF
jgi:hypothetical protein